MRELIEKAYYAGGLSTMYNHTFLHNFDKNKKLKTSCNDIAVGKIFGYEYNDVYIYDFRRNIGRRVDVWNQNIERYLKGVRFKQIDKNIVFLEIDDYWKTSRALLNIVFKYIRWIYNAKTLENIEESIERYLKEYNTTKSSYHRGFDDIIKKNKQHIIYLFEKQMFDYFKEKDSFLSDYNFQKIPF